MMRGSIRFIQVGMQEAGKREKAQSRDIDQERQLVREKQNDFGRDCEVDDWWCQDLDQSQIKHELGLAESTVVDWDSFCREVCEITMFENSEKLGGEGKFVQIDESKFD